jgi:RNA polymerase subunit RPABC4/transcription elongation factor Spt4
MEALIARSIQILIALGGAYILTLWFAIVVWTFQDIQARSRSVVAQIFSTLVVLIFSVPGLLIYLILRPRYTLDDAFQRSLEEEYLMQDLEELPLCPACQQYVEDDWVFCPNCRTELRDNCIVCDQLIDLRWEICPFCGAEQYEDQELPLSPPADYPVITPSPQFLGRPQLSPAQAYQLTSSDEERTRPIIPATVRVDLRSGDISTEQVPALPISTPWQPTGGHTKPRRVSLASSGLLSELADDQDDVQTKSQTTFGNGAVDYVDAGTDPVVPEMSDIETGQDGLDEPIANEPEAKSSSSVDQGDGAEAPKKVPSEPRNKGRKRRARRSKAQGNTVGSQ